MPPGNPNRLTCRDLNHRHLFSDETDSERPFQCFILNLNRQFAEQDRANEEYHFSNEKTPWTSLRKNSRDRDENRHGKHAPDNSVTDLRVLVVLHKSSRSVVEPSCGA